MTPNHPDVEEYRRELDNLSLPKFAALATDRPFVVAVEGPNGAGKTTLCRTLAEKMGATHCLGTDEAWFGPAFKTRMIRDAAWYASAMFFLSGCFEQMRLIQTRTEPLIIMDRCLWSTFAVHGAETPLRLAALIEMLRPIASEIPLPHRTLVLEASFSTCQARISRKSGEAKALDELTATERFHSRERELYRWLSTQIPNVTFLDANEAGPERVANQAMTAIQPSKC